MTLSKLVNIFMAELLSTIFFCKQVYKKTYAFPEIFSEIDFIQDHCLFYYT